MALSATFRMADRLADGQLEATLRGYIAEGKSQDAICRQLFADFGIEVTRQTIANWVKTLGIEKPEPVEAVG